VEGKGRAFVLGLGGSGIAGDEILVVAWSNGIEIHGSRGIQQNHSVICRRFRSIKSSERGRHNLLGVALGSMLKMAGISRREVCGRWFDCRSHPATSHIHRRDNVWLHSLSNTSLSVIQDPVEAFLSGIFVSSP
jgi:hypothetical protein